MLGSIFDDGVTLSDHSGALRVATFGSIATYLRRHHALEEQFALSGISSSVAISHRT
ncbi:MAG: hypothetical protein ACI9BW_004819 [Gammaproteobacteria bacterium]|jgi:hypothetical protein